MTNPEERREFVASAALLLFALAIFIGLVGLVALVCRWVWA